jgi:hypothetical protein
MSRGLKPAFFCASNVEAKASTYLRTKGKNNGIGNCKGSRGFLHFIPSLREGIPVGMTLSNQISRASRRRRCLNTSP